MLTKSMVESQPLGPAVELSLLTLTIVALAVGSLHHTGGSCSMVDIPRPFNQGMRSRILYTNWI